MKSIPRELWIEIEKIFPIKKTNVGRPEFDRYKAFLGMAYVLRNGSLWHSLPEKYGCPSTIHGKFIRWCKLGIFEKILKMARNIIYKSINIETGMPLILFPKKLLLQNSVAKIQPIEQNEA